MINKTTALLFLGLITSAACFAGKLQVVTTTTDLASITEEIAGDLANVKSICSGNQDPHHLQARPKYILMARKADLWIRIGMELEIGWEMPVIDGSRNRKIRPGNTGHLDISTRILKLEVPNPNLLSRAMGDVHAQGNPHYLTDPLNAKYAAGDIADRLALLDPKNADTYKKNAQLFSDRIDQQMIVWKKAMKPLDGQSIVTYHRSWLYFCERFGLNITIELEPKPGIPPSPAHLTRVIQTIQAEQIGIILQEPWYSQKAAKRVAEKTNARIVTAPIYTGSDPKAENYMDLISLIVERLTKETE